MTQSMTKPSAMGLDFTRWAELTDDYAKQVAALERGERGAKEQVQRLARELRLLDVPSQLAQPLE